MINKPDLIPLVLDPDGEIIFLGKGFCTTTSSSSALSKSSEYKIGKRRNK